VKPERKIKAPAGFRKLSAEIIACEKCPRLRKYCLEVAQQKKREFINWEYWGKPVAGFGDPNAEVWIIGLAPAAHGANRTGRMFTGDSSGNWLYRALYKAGFANQPTALSRHDGLSLKRVFISAVVRCAPPKNKPSRKEMENCRSFLEREWKLLKNLKVVICLGRIAFENSLRLLKKRASPEKLPSAISFFHGAVYKLPKPLPTLIASYHPSRQNTQTGKLREPMFNAIFEKAQKLLQEKE